MSTGHLHGYARIFHGHSRIRNLSSLSTFGIAHVFSMKLSPDGKFLAIGNDDGILEIRMFETSEWKRVCLYTTGAAIRTLVWHPSQDATVFSGCANGGIHKVTVVLDGVDVLCDAVVPGYVHFLALNADGQKLVIAHGRTISVVNNPFPQRNDLGTLVNLGVPVVDNIQAFTDYHIPRGVFFLPDDENTILIAFFGKRDIQAYSLTTQSASWSISLRPNSFLGSSAISPSGERIAVMNMRDGIDFYSTSRRQFLSTTTYTLTTQQPPQNLVADILFVDDETVAFGHSDGYVAFATFGVGTTTGQFNIDGNGPKAAIQTIAFGITEGHALILGLVPPTNSSRQTNRYASDIHIGRIETGTAHNVFLPDSSHPMAMRHLNGSMSNKTVALIIAFSIVVTLFGQSLFRQRPPLPLPSTSNTPSTHPAISPSLPGTPPAQTCICTMTGTFMSARESGGI